MAKQAKLASMGEMLSMIAHQWRQPLNSINSNVAVVHIITAKHLPNNTFLQQKLDNITSQTQFMSNTIEDFSGFFRPDKTSSCFNPSETLQKALKLIDIHSEGITLIFKKEKTEMICGYENEYLQVLLTILHNAIENFSANRTENPTIHFTFRSSKTDVSLFIQDNGGGIQAENPNIIFDPYFTTNHRGNNSGLGLYMAKLLIEESMLGTLRVTNKNGGACFEITLPKGEKDGA